MGLCGACTFGQGSGLQGLIAVGRFVEDDNLEDLTSVWQGQIAVGLFVEEVHLIRDLCCRV